MFPNNEAETIALHKFCEQCEKEYNGRGKRFCSPKCWADWRRKIRACEQCNTGYSGQNKRFCSHKCYAKWQMQTVERRGKNNSNWKGGTAKRICEICGKKFEVCQATAANGGGRFCSYACLGRSNSEMMAGRKVRIETRRKLSKLAHARWLRGDFDGVFQSPTSIELAIATALDICGIKHVTQYRPDGYSKVFDEFVPPNLFIEVHGDYWHSMEKAQKRDAEKAAWAKDNGYRLVLIWEHEIKKQGAQALVTERVLPVIKTEI